MKKFISQVSLGLFYLLLLLSTVFPSIPGESIWFPLLVLISIIPLLMGPDQYRLFGGITLVLALVLLYGDIKYGKVYKEKQTERRQRIMQDRDINR
ncbi:MAG: hypothetical protein V2A34_08215 [Lentisphaerota bacterium]